MSLLKDLNKFRKKEKISMHIPGHKSGRGLGAYFIKNAIKLDLTELDGTDNLQNPTGILKSAQDFCAGIFGANKTYFLTGGSSLGLRAAILGCTNPGDKLLVDRTCHRSVLSAITLGGIEPIFISPVFDKEKGLYIGISAEEINCILTDNPDIAGAIITSPTYYGICSDIKNIAHSLHSFGKFLIVDEAHGAHFAFSKKLPETALSQGADVCIQSAHKTLPALGQCSFLHTGRDFRFTNRLQRTLKMIQSTSPSYLLMTSLDESARYMNHRGKRKMSVLLREIENLKNEVCEKTVLKFADSSSMNLPCDSSRITVDFSGAEISGRYAEKLLIEQFGIYPEMADGRYVVLIPTVANTVSEIRQLKAALIEIGTRRYNGEKPFTAVPLPEIKSAYKPQEAHSKQSEILPVSSCIGRVSAEVVSACPPGAAVVIPGQIIDESAVSYIIKNNVTDTIDVIKE